MRLGVCLVAGGRKGGDGGAVLTPGRQGEAAAAGAGGGDRCEAAATLVTAGH